jgi:hypothetical protein
MSGLKNEEFSKKVMEAMRIAVKKVVDDARARKDYIVVGDRNGNVLHVYPHLEDEKREKEFLEAIRKQAPNL